MAVGALAIAGGVATTTTSAVQLGLSYSGETTAEQDREISNATSTALSLSSPGGLLGGTIGTATYGEEGLHKGAFIGGMTEAGGGLLYSGGRMMLRELEFGIPNNPGWGNPVRQGIQDSYGLADAAARARPNPAFPRGIERMDLSHWIPQRWTRGTRWEWITNRPWNITPMWAGEHALIDQFRLNFIKQPWKATYEALQVEGLSKQIQLMPPWLVELLSHSSLGATRSQAGEK